MKTVRAGALRRCEQKQSLSLSLSLLQVCAPGGTLARLPRPPRGSARSARSLSATRARRLRRVALSPRVWLARLSSLAIRALPAEGEIRVERVGEVFRDRVI